MNQEWVSILGELDQKYAAADEWWTSASEREKIIVWTAIQAMVHTPHFSTLTNRGFLAHIVGNMAANEFLRLALKHEGEVAHEDD